MTLIFSDITPTVSNPTVLSRAIMDTLLLNLNIDRLYMVSDQSNISLYSHLECDIYLFTFGKYIGDVNDHITKHIWLPRLLNLRCSICSNARHDTYRCDQVPQMCIVCGTRSCLEPIKSNLPYCPICYSAKHCGSCKSQKCPICGIATDNTVEHLEIVHNTSLKDVIHIKYACRRCGKEDIIGHHCTGKDLDYTSIRSRNLYIEDKPKPRLCTECYQYHKSPNCPVKRNCGLCDIKDITEDHYAKHGCKSKEEILALHHMDLPNQLCVDCGALIHSGPCERKNDCPFCAETDTNLYLHYLQIHSVPTRDIRSFLSEYNKGLQIIRKHIFKCTMVCDKCLCMHDSDICNINYKCPLCGVESPDKDSHTNHLSLHGCTNIADVKRAIALKE